MSTLSTEPIPWKDFAPENIPNLTLNNNSDEPFYYREKMSSLLKKHINSDTYIAVFHNHISVVDNFIRHNHLKFDYMPNEQTILNFDWHKNEAVSAPGVFQGVIKIHYKDEEVLVFVMPRVSQHETICNMIACDNYKILKKFCEELSTFVAPQKVYVFDGAWKADIEMDEQLKNLSWDNLILENEVKTDLIKNIDMFFNNGESVYKKLGVDYKRGIILVGPPGSGKTTVGKIVAGSYDIPFIYVTSFKYNNNIENGIREVYRFAKTVSPCIVMIEDLDTQISDATRTVFLNTLDGLEGNNGVLTLATTNHPENIDAALTKRPSRFDKKFIFKNPDKTKRIEYLNILFAKIVENLEDIKATVETVADKTSGYSYAYLKELYTQAGLFWLSSGEKISLEEAIFQAYENTKSQVKMDSSDRLSQSIDQQEKQKLGFRV